MKHGFTLIELIVVIIIVGILAAVGISQYTKVVEKGRSAEARMILGQMRQLAYQYWLGNGTVTGIPDAAVNLSNDPANNVIPTLCESRYYFRYYTYGGTDGSLYRGKADRCASGGKTPDAPGSTGDTYIILNSDFSAGTNTWQVHGF